VSASLIFKATQLKLEGQEKGKGKNSRAKPPDKGNSHRNNLWLTIVAMHALPGYKIFSCDRCGRSVVRKKKEKYER
jgi:hypothetical protein